MEEALDLREHVFDLDESESEVAKMLNLVDVKTVKLTTHTLRFWEKEFKQIKPKIFAGKCPIGVLFP